VSGAGAWTRWPAPAKLNLFLHIVGRRADGYHLLQTAFQLLDWGDEVRLRVVLARVVHDRLEALLDGLRVLDADENAACFRLVQDLRRDDLQHDGKAHFACNTRRFLRALGDAFLRHGNAVGVAGELAFGRRQRRASLGLDLVDDAADRRLVVRH